MIDVFGKIIRPVAFAVGVALVILLALVWLATVGGLIWGLPFSSFLFPGTTFLSTLGVINLLILIGIPLLMIILAVMRIFMRTNFKPRYAAGLWAFWVVNIISLFFVATTTVKQFSTGSTVSLGSQSGFTTADTLFVDLENNSYHDVIFHIGPELAMSGDKLISYGINLRVEKSESGNFEILQNNYSRGSSTEESQQLAGSIGYEYNLNGNTLSLPTAFIIPKGTKWRGQKPNITIKVPEGKWVKISGNKLNTNPELVYDENYKFPWWNFNYAYKMGPNGLIAPDYIKEKQKDYSFENFTKIRIEGQIKLRIRKGDKFEVRLAQGKDYEDDIQIRQSENRLDISTDTDPGEPILLEITMPSIEELEAYSTDDIDIRDFKLEKLRIVNDGEAQIKAFIDVDDLQVELTGSNELDIRGSGRLLKANLSAHAHMDAEFFTVKVADIQANDDSWVKTSATDTLRTRVDEGSELISKNKPVVIEQ